MTTFNPSTIELNDGIVSLEENLDEILSKDYSSESPYIFPYELEDTPTEQVKTEESISIPLERENTNNISVDQLESMDEEEIEDLTNTMDEQQLEELANNPELDDDVKEILEEKLADRNNEMTSQS